MVLGAGRSQLDVEGDKEALGGVAAFGEIEEGLALGAPAIDRVEEGAVDIGVAGGLSIGEGGTEDGSIAAEDDVDGGALRVCGELGGDAEAWANGDDFEALARGGAAEFDVDRGDSGGRGGVGLADFGGACAGGDRCADASTGDDGGGGWLGRLGGRLRGLGIGAVGDAALGCDAKGLAHGVAHAHGHGRGEGQGGEECRLLGEGRHDQAGELNGLGVIEGFVGFDAAILLDGDVGVALTREEGLIGDGQVGCVIDLRRCGRCDVEGGVGVLGSGGWGGVLRFAGGEACGLEGVAGGIGVGLECALGCWSRGGKGHGPFAGGCGGVARLVAQGCGGVLRRGGGRGFGRWFGGGFGWLDVGVALGGAVGGVDRDGARVG